MENNSNQSGTNNNYQGSNYSVSSGPGYFSCMSYKKEKDENSGRHFDNFEDPILSIYDELKLKCKDDICFKILQKSKFILNVNKEDNKTFSEFTKITTSDMDIDYNMVINSTSKEKIVKDNYNKFKTILNIIQKEIEKNCPNNLSFTVILNFETTQVGKLGFDIKCLYNLEIPNEFNGEYKDENILNDPLENGLEYLINELKEINES